MTPASTPMTLLIAAQEAAQSAALADMIQAIRPGIRVLHLESTLEDEHPGFAMVVESVGPNFGELSARVHERFPAIPIVVIAPRFEEEAISKAARLGISTLLPSPCEPAALLRVLKAHERRVAFAGRADQVETKELLRLYAAAGSNGVLHLGSSERNGAIHFEDGHPVHAHAGELRGVAAVQELLTWTEVEATWINGRSASARTIIGRIEGLLERGPVEGGGDSSDPAEGTPPDVMMRLEKLASSEDILATYLMRNTEIVTGITKPEIDEAVVGRALSRLAQVFHDMEEQQGDIAGSEIQATVGEHRLVVDRMGPTRLGFQVGVVVRQATPVCKSLRRLIRQIDRSFRRSLAQGHGRVSPVRTANLHRVA